MTDLVWYAAYGSNLSAHRFTTYLSGGPAEHRTIDTPQAGARDATPPIANRSWEIRHRLFFAAASKSWGGGSVAFLDPNAEFGQRTYTRLWLVTAQQFEDVFRQENGITVPDVDDRAEPLFTIDDLDAGGHVDLADGWYGRLLHLGPGPDGHPIATFTGADPGRHTIGPAHSSYLRTIGIGLMERFRLKPGGAAKYLAERDGNAGIVNRRDLAADLAEWVPPS